MKRTKLLTALLLTATIAFTACGSSAEPTKTSSASADSTSTSTSETVVSEETASSDENAIVPETTEVTLYGVNDLQISAAMMIAENQGYFAEEGLNVECVYMANVPEIAAIMANGDAKIACANNYSTPTWRLNGAPCKIIAPTCNMGGTQCLLLRKDIEITCAEDLEGLTMGMVSGSTQYVTFRNMCKSLGLDPDSFTITTLQFADQLSALSSGDIDIMAVPEPWVTKAQEQCDAFLLCSGTKSYIPGAEGDVLWCNMYATLNANDEWAAENPNTIKCILKAFKKATEFINDNRDEAVTILAAHIGMSEEDTAKIMTENVYVYGVDDTYVDTAITLEEFMAEEDILPGGETIPFADYHDFSFLRSVTPECYTASTEY